MDWTQEPPTMELAAGLQVISQGRHKRGAVECTAPASPSGSSFAS